MATAQQVVVGKKTGPLTRKEKAFLLFFVGGGFLVAPLAVWLCIIGYISIWYIVLMFTLYFLCAHGITVGYHRYVTHQSFTATKPLKVWLLIWGAMGLEGGPIDWGSKHHKHHQNSDTEDDPHSPISIRKRLHDRSTRAGRLFGHLQRFFSRWASVEQDTRTGWLYHRFEIFVHSMIVDPEDEDSLPGLLYGLWHAHVAWFYNDKRPEPEKYAPYLLKDPMMRWFNRTFLLWAMVSFVIPTLFGGYIGWRVGDGVWWGFLYGLTFGGAARMFLVHHFTWAVNSVCHVWGDHPFFSGPNDHSGNVTWWGIFSIGTLGEGWHGNHHAFPRSAVHAMIGSKLIYIKDISYGIIKLFELCRLASNVKVPEPNEYTSRRERQQQLLVERQQQSA